MSTKYTEAPGAEGVGPPVCATATPDAAKTAKYTAPQRTMLYPIRGLVIIPLLALPRSAGASRAVLALTRCAGAHAPLVPLRLA
jgi:hypothetical protein